MRAELRTHDLRPNDVDLTPGARWTLRCPDCGQWWSIQRSQITRHRADPDRPEWCPGSRRRVLVEHPAEWALRLQQAVVECDVRAGIVPFMPAAANPEQMACREGAAW